jgi:FixJ family two-component response regulator
MAEPPTIFIIDPVATSVPLVRAIAKQMGVKCTPFLRGEDLVAMYRPSMPGCVLTEFRLAGINGIELQESLAERGIALPMVFVTSHAETRLTVRAMQNGAITVLTKPPAEQELWDAIRRALQQDADARRVRETQNAVQRRLGTLTPKERQVLDRLVLGESNKAIANHLDISVRTVETRRREIFKKMKAGSVVELVRIVLTSNPDCTCHLRSEV